MGLSVSLSVSLSLSLNLSISHPLSFSFSLFYPLPPVRVRIVATYFWFCGNLEFMYINSFLSQPSRESPTISFAETYFQFHAGRNVGGCRHSPHRELSN